MTAEQVAETASADEKPAKAGANRDERRPLVSVNDLKKYFPVRGGLFRRVVAHVKAVDGVDLDDLQEIKQLILQREAELKKGGSS